MSTQELTQRKMHNTPVDFLHRTKASLKKALYQLEEDIKSASGDKPRLLFVCPHLSTGGMPQYLLKKIQVLNDQADIWCIQYADTAPIYDVQKRQIVSILKDKFFCLGDDKAELVNLIEKIAPDVIHFEDFVEFFIDDKIIEKIYTANRPYLIAETCHNSNVKPEDKRWYCDKLVMVNQWMCERFSTLDIPTDIHEYPIEDLPRLSDEERKEIQSSLGLDPTKKHIINIGLFTPGKNQGELATYARLAEKEGLPYQFHFIGNQAINFKDYWEPIMKNLPSNCKIWGERHDTETFYSFADLFVFTSNWELNPIVIKETLSWKVPLMMKRLTPYMDFYDDMELVTYLENNSIDNMRLIKKILK